MVQTRKIQMYPFIQDLHTIHNTLVTNPPKGYEFIGSKTSKLYNFRKKISGSKVLRFLYHLFLKVFKTTKVIEATQTASVMPEADMLFGGIIYNSPKPWVLYMFDHPACLAGNNYELFLKNKERIVSALNSNQCKAIICTNEAHLPFMKEHFPKSVNDKIALVDLGVADRIIKKKYNKEKIRILFMGSINNPRDFYVKGGLYVLEVFKRLSERKDVELVMRCNIPAELQDKARKIKNLVLMDKKVPYEEIIKLYEGTDILFMPGHHYSVTSFIESMSFGIPIVALNTYAVGDFVTDKYNGRIIQRSDKIKGYNDPGYPTSIRTDEFSDEIKTARDDALITRLVQGLVELIEHPGLIEQYGKNSRKRFETRHTIEVRNKGLKKVFDKLFRRTKV